MRGHIRRHGKGWAYVSYSKADGMNGKGFRGTLPFKKLTHVRPPSEAMVFVEESDPRNENHGTWALRVNERQWADPFAIFHGVTSTFSFADGHVQAHTWTDPDVIAAAKRSADGISAFRFPGAGPNNPDFVWIWNRYRHVKWRPL